MQAKEEPKAESDATFLSSCADDTLSSHDILFETTPDRIEQTLPTTSGRLRGNLGHTFFGLSAIRRADVG